MWFGMTMYTFMQKRAGLMASMISPAILPQKCCIAQKKRISFNSVECDSREISQSIILLCNKVISQTK